MLWQGRREAARYTHVPDRETDALVVRLRRLALHRGYDRRQLVSPLLQRLMPLRKLGGSPAAETAELQQRVKEAGLDRNAVAYLLEAVENELDNARLRLMA